MRVKEIRVKQRSNYERQASTIRSFFRINCMLGYIDI